MKSTELASFFLALNSFATKALKQDNITEVRVRDLGDCVLFQAVYVTKDAMQNGLDTSGLPSDPTRRMGFGVDDNDVPMFEAFYLVEPENLTDGAKLREIVFEALDNARANGDYRREHSASGMANNLTLFCADLENHRPETLLPHIVAWKEIRDHG